MPLRVTLRRFPRGFWPSAEVVSSSICSHSNTTPAARFGLCRLSIPAGGESGAKPVGAATNRPSTVAQTLPEAFRNATLYCDNDRTYKLLRLSISSLSPALELWKASASSFLSSSKPSVSNTFGCFMMDKDEITMMVPVDVYNEHCQTTTSTIDTNGTAADKVARGEKISVSDNGIEYRLFTFDNVVLDPSLVGFMTVVTRALADQNISVLPYAAYSTDHVFVAKEDAETAQRILRGLSEALPDGIDTGEENNA